MFSASFAKTPSGGAGQENHHRLPLPFHRKKNPAVPTLDSGRAGLAESSLEEGEEGDRDRGRWRRKGGSSRTSISCTSTARSPRRHLRRSITGRFPGFRATLLRRSPRSDSRSRPRHGRSPLLLGPPTTLRATRPSPVSDLCSWIRSVVCVSGLFPLVFSSPQSIILSVSGG